MIIQDLIIFVLCTVFWVLGIYLITQKGMFLYFLRQLVEKAKPEWIGKPILTCIECMASLHGLLIFIILCSQWIIESNIWTLILGIVMSAFIQSFLYNLYESIVERTKYYKRLSQVN